MSQEYEAKLVELEAALVHQLKTDTAVEKLEAQRQVMRATGRGSCGAGLLGGASVGWGCGEVGGTETGNELWVGLLGGDELTTGAYVGQGC